MPSQAYALEKQVKTTSQKCRIIMWSAMGCLLLVVVLAVAVTLSQQGAILDLSEEGAVKFLTKFDKEFSEITTKNVILNWKYESNITDYNLEKKLESAAEEAAFSKRIAEEAQKFPWTTFKDQDIQRRFRHLIFLGSSALSPEKFNELEKIKSSMQSTYAKATVCDFRDKTKCDLHLEPEITKLMQNSRDAAELEHLWTSWRNSSGRQVKDLFPRYVELLNEAALKNNYSNAALMWIRGYEADDFPEQVEALWQQLQPLYLQLHAYVRGQLRKMYGEKVISKSGLLPAHLLGNMWAQTWEHTADFTIPFPNKPALNVTPALIEQGYTPEKIFKLSEKFFTSLNLSAMPESFWKNSLLEKPKDGRDLVCHASAWDFYDGKDFRIKQCTEVNQNHLETAHHEMGHIQYFLQYKDQPSVYKEGANPGFHEAVGDTISLSVGTPSHLHKINLLSSIPDDYEGDINQLFNVALHKIAFLPYGFLMDQYRWSIFRGDIKPEDYNCKWWELREKYQGLEPPAARSEDFFDAGAKYHIVGGVPYIRYFVSFVVQFQFHRSLCEAAGQYDPAQPNLKPLHKCDIYESLEAGKLLGDMLKMGSSKPWPVAMKALTGQEKMDAGALLQYFRPLQTWLEAENKRTGEPIGWTPTEKECKRKI